MELITSGNNQIIQLLSGRSNVFALKHHSGKTLVIDTSVRLMRRFLDKALDRAKMPRVDYLLLTHCHFDHAGNAAYIKESRGARVAIQTSEADNLRRGGMDIPDGTNAVTETLVGLARKVNFTLTSEPCEPDILVDQSLSLPDAEGVEIIHTPGHSKGSVSILVDNEIAFVGDTMINVPLFRVFPPFAEDTHQLMASWRKLLDTTCHTFLPSHGSALTRNELTGALWELERKMDSR